jgi:hypothetical protein
MQYIALWEDSVGGNDVTIILCNGLSDWISEYDAFHTSFDQHVENCHVFDICSWQWCRMSELNAKIMRYIDDEGWGFPARNHK